MSALDDLLDNLFNPFQKGALENPYAPPDRGTPSLTDPGTYTPTTPGSGPGPYTPWEPPGVIDDPYDDDDDNTTTQPPSPPPPPPEEPPEPPPEPPEPPPEPPEPPPEPPGPPNNPYQFGGGNYARAADLRGVDPFGWSKRSPILSGHAISPPKTMSIDDFVNNVLPKAAGRYGEGMHYDPETGSVFSNISPEKYKELSDKKLTMFGVNTAYMTDDELYRSYLHGHNPGAITGTSMVRMGTDTGQYYFINPDNPNEVIYYDYMTYIEGMPSFAGPGKDGGPPPSNILKTPGQVGDPYADELMREQRAMMPALRNKIRETELAEAAAKQAEAEQPQEETLTGAETLMDSEVAEKEAPAGNLEPVVDPMSPNLPPIEGIPGLQELGPDFFNQIMASFGGGQGQNMLSPYGSFNLDMPLTMQEPTPQMDVSAGMMGQPPNPMASLQTQMGPPPGMEQPLGPMGPMGPMGPPPGPMGPPPGPMGPTPGMMAPPPPAPPTPSIPMPPGLQPPSMGAPELPSSTPEPTLPPNIPEPPAPSPTGGPMAGLTPEEIAAIQQAAAQLFAGSINFNQGGPVQSGVGSLFRREVMR